MRLIRKHKIAKYVIGSLLLLVIGVAGVAPAYAMSCSDVPSDQQQACSDAEASAQNYCAGASSDQQQNCSDSIANCATQSSPSAYIGCLNKIASAPGSSASDSCGNASDCTDPAVIDAQHCSGNVFLQCTEIYSKFIRPLISFLAVGVGLIVVIMVIVGGVQYVTAAGDPQAAANARKRIFNAIFALVVFIFLYALLNWLVPGGVKLP